MATANASVSLYVLTLGRALALPLVPACCIQNNGHNILGQDNPTTTMPLLTRLYWLRSALHTMSATLRTDHAASRFILRRPGDDEYGFIT